MDTRRQQAARRGAIAGAVVALAVALTGCQTGAAAPPPTVPLPAGATVADISASGGDLFFESEVGSPSVVLYDRLTGSGGQLWLYDDSTRTRVDLGIPFTGTSQASASTDARVVVFSSPDPALQNGPLAKNCRFQTSPVAPFQPSYCSELYLLDRTDGTRRPLTGIAGSSLNSSTVPVVSPDGLSVTYWSSNTPGPSPERFVMDIATGAISPAPAEPDPNSWDHGTYHVTWSSSDGLVRTDTATGDVVQLSPGGSNTPWDRSADGRYVVMGSYSTTFQVIDVVDGSARTIPVPNIDDDATRYVGVLYVDSPGIDRLITGDIPPES
jgi:hypothetical protein